jgi:hypothetical protein
MRRSGSASEAQAAEVATPALASRRDATRHARDPPGEALRLLGVRRRANAQLLTATVVGVLAIAARIGAAAGAVGPARSIV